MKGFSLIEVLVALVVIMVFFLGVSKTALLSTRSCTYSQDLTCASMLGHSKLLALKGLPFDSADLSPAWHQDPDNPIIRENRGFYCFWQVSDVSLGRSVELFVAWTDSQREAPVNFSSLADLQRSGCPRIDFADVFQAP